jgi:hypothetical protein
MIDSILDADKRDYAKYAMIIFPPTINSNT